HVPLTLYSDDTFGNVSKKFNQHMCIYCTLSGLPPKLTDQEFNVHPLACSNIASALEIADQIIKEVNCLTCRGFIGSDAALNEEVLVIPWILCHLHCQDILLGDSPMHAEITNTTNPAGMLNPCHMCNLTVESKSWKQSETYVHQFVGVDSMGDQVCALHGLHRALGQLETLTDSLNLEFVNNIYEIHWKNKKQKDKSKHTPAGEIVKLCQDIEALYGVHIYNPFLCLLAFNGHHNTPIESLHVVYLLTVAKYFYRYAVENIPENQTTVFIGQWEAFNISGLAIDQVQVGSMVKYANSLLDKEFQVVLQVAAFVLFNHIEEDHRVVWETLGHLAPYIFQTLILNKDKYMTELKTLINQFLQLLNRILARWTNKPIFCILIHLGMSVKFFGPPSLFSTQTFENYNTITHKASVNSNQQAPGCNISDTSNNGQLMRVLMTGTEFWDATLQRQLQVGPCVRALWSHKEI
ncbi:hypothetical protein CROQUDRAFT_36055, partial [Cronartium quercuum f. sp. fusiforme G11]